MRQFVMAKIDVLAGVGTTIVFNVDAKDAEFLTKDFQELVKVKDIINGQASGYCAQAAYRELCGTLQPLTFSEILLSCSCP